MSWLILYILIGFIVLWVGERESAKKGMTPFGIDDIILVVTVWWLILALVIHEEVKRERRERARHD